MISFIKKNKMLSLAIVSLIVLFIISPNKGSHAIINASENFKSVGMVLPPIFVLIGLLDVWVPKELMVKYMGDGSGVIGGVLAVILGSVGAGPLIVAFPIGALLVRKGARLAYVFLFLGSWTSVKLPLFMFEWVNFGGVFTTLNAITSITVYLISGFLIEKLLSKENHQYILDKSNQLG